MHISVVLFFIADSSARSCWRDLCPQIRHQAYLDSDVHVETNKKGVYMTRLQLRIHKNVIGPSQLSRSLMVKSSPLQSAELFPQHDSPSSLATRSSPFRYGNIFQHTSSVWPRLHRSRIDGMRQDWLSRQTVPSSNCHKVY